MDDFNNFFDDQRQPEREHIPNAGYHMHGPKNGGSKNNLVVMLCIILAFAMCIIVVVNIIVLASLKDKIATEYASSISAEMREQYEQAIKEALDGTNIVSDVTAAATRDALGALSSTIGEKANGYACSVARLYMYYDENVRPTTASAQGLATAFLITDSADGYRYLLTNAHCVRYVKTTRTGSSYPWGFGGGISYEWASFGTIVAVFEGDSTYYETEIVSFGTYNDDNLSAEADRKDQPDLAILRIKGTQPSNEDRPALRLASSDSGLSRGMPVALIGNPEGVGETNSITSGTISHTGITISSWGAGTFVMTDAAVNSGNSGGPMLNSLGIVVGVVESKLASTNIDNMGFAISPTTVRNFIEWSQHANNNELGIDIRINCIYE